MIEKNSQEKKERKKKYNANILKLEREGKCRVVKIHLNLR